MVIVGYLEYLAVFESGVASCLGLGEGDGFCGMKAA